MSLKKKDLEIIYNLRWKNGAPKEENVVGVYDIPATTLNWEVFKSYLLKNSGTTGDDVNVSYVMDSGNEYPIQSQTDFQVVLYAFRRKARSGEIIDLRLEKISDIPIHKNMRHSNDVETQFDNSEQHASIVSNCCNLETSPEWFSNAIIQLKKEITDEVTAAVSSVVSTALSNLKLPAPNPSACYYHSRKPKTDKRLRKLTPHLVDPNGELPPLNAKDLMKSLKLDNKLEKLERKATKCKEKRMALFTVARSSDSDVAGPSAKPRGRCHKKEEEEDEGEMDAQPIRLQQMAPHMLGGEVYLHQWEVKNCGKASWTTKTYLQYAWGSKGLEPLNKVINVPFLKPGEQGIISVRFQIPNMPGKYESYWQFMHKKRRFGHWLGCQVIVDPFDLKGNNSVLEISIEEKGILGEERDGILIPEDLICHYSNSEGPSSLQEFTWKEDPKIQPETQIHDTFSHVYVNLNELGPSTSQGAVVKSEPLNINDPTDTNCSSDSDNHSVASSNVSNKSLDDEFVVIPVPPCFTLEEKGNQKSQIQKKEEEEEEENCDSNNNTESIRVIEAPVDENDKERIVFIHSVTPVTGKNEKVEKVIGFSEPQGDEIRNREGFLFIHSDGQRVLVPKNILSSKVITATEKAEGAKCAETGEGQEQSTADDKSGAKEEEEEIATDASTQCCASVAASCASTEGGRLFIFPEDYPGFEVVRPCVADVLDDEPLSHVPNFQQTPPEMRPVLPPVVAQEAAPAAEFNAVDDARATPPLTPSAPPAPIHILPETFVSGAVSAASSAINTARSVINMIRTPQPPQSGAGAGATHDTEVGRGGPSSLRLDNLHALQEMGFWNRDLNAVLLERFHDDLSRVVTELVQ